MSRFVISNIKTLKDYHDVYEILIANNFISDSFYSAYHDERLHAWGNSTSQSREWFMDSGERERLRCHEIPEDASWRRRSVDGERGAGRNEVLWRDRAFVRGGNTSRNFQNWKSSGPCISARIKYEYRLAIPALRSNCINRNCIDEPY